MKKITKILICSLLLCAVLVCVANAKLSDAQKESLIEYTEKFVEEGNSRGLLQYGSFNNYVTYQLGLVHPTRCIVKSGDSEIKTIWMMNPRGYATYSAYQASLKSATQGYFKEGDYLILDCSAFVALMYKEVFGLRFDYGISGHISNWTTSHYLLDEHADERRIVDPESGETKEIFEVISAIDHDTATDLSLRDMDIAPDELQVGDIIVGLNRNSDWGHIIFYAGDGYIYHSSSTPYVLPDGSVHNYLIRKEPLKNLSNRSYTMVKVLRINDGILPEGFEGYDFDVDFDALTLDSRAFDTTPPVIESVTVSNDFVKGNLKKMTVLLSDEIGEGTTLYFIGDDKKVLRGPSDGASGVMGIYASVSGTAPTDIEEFGTLQATHYEELRAKGQYYLWAIDAAQNLSVRHRVVIGEEASYVYRSPEDGEEVLLSTFIAGEDGAHEDQKPASPAVPIVIAAVAVVAVAAVIFVVLSKKKKA